MAKLQSKSPQGGEDGSVAVIFSDSVKKPDVRFEDNSEEAKMYFKENPEYRRQVRTIEFLGRIEELVAVPNGNFREVFFII